MWNPDGAKNASVNLSTHSASSSSAVLSVVRAERQVRERQRVLENSATTVQRIFRGRSAAEKVKEDVLDKLELGGNGVREGVRGLMFIMPGSLEERGRVAHVLTEWCSAAVQTQGEIRDLK
jgi:ubiquitin-protein ligase E3 C